MMTPMPRARLYRCWPTLILFGLPCMWALAATRVGIASASADDCAEIRHIASAADVLFHDLRGRRLRTEDAWISKLNLPRSECEVTQDDDASGGLSCTWD